MFITIRRGRIILYVLTACFTLIFLLSVFFESPETVATFGTPVAGKIIVIDPGHGGADPGAFDNDIYEKELNLDIALLLKNFIEENGGTVIMTRDSDKSTADENRPANISQKKSDLLHRKNISKNMNADAFISIHMNKFPEAKYKGAQVFYAPNSAESQKFGELIQSSLIKNADPQNTRNAKKGKSIFVLKDAGIPSALVECGFISNPDEAKLLQTESYRQKIAWSIFMGINDFWASQ